MQSSGGRLWKQIGCQGLIKQHLLKNNQNQQNFDTQKKNKLYQQFQQPLQELQSSFQKLQLSEIIHKDLNEVVSSFVNKPKGYGIFNDLENMLSDVCQNNKTQDINPISKMQNKNKKYKKQKYFEACKLFKSILKNLRENIQFFQKWALKQVQKSKAFKHEIERQFKNVEQTISSVLEDRLKQVIQLSRKCQQLQEKLEQKYQTEIKLKFQIDELSNKIQLSTKESLNNYEKHHHQMQQLKQQNYKILKLNSDLSEKIFDLQQKMQGFDLQVQKKAQKMIKQSIHILRDDHIKKAEQFQQISQFSLRGVSISPICQLKLEKSQKFINQQSQHNYFRSAQLQKNNFYTVQSAKQSMIDDVQRRRTFSHFNQNFIKNVQNPQIHESQFKTFQKQVQAQKQSIYTVSQNKLKKLLLQPKSISQHEKKCHYVYGQGKKNEDFNKKLSNQTWNSNFRSKQKQKNICRFNGTQSLLEQERKKSSNIDDLSLRLNKMKVQIQSQIKNLKSSISTNV